jgi:uncharacterized protein YndB with AHSA1/START domain
MGTEIGVLAVRRSIMIDVPPERVWREFESFDRMVGWFGTGHRLVSYEPRVSGWVELEVDIEGPSMRFGGRVSAFDPPRELTFEDDWIPTQGWDAPTLITVRLMPALGGTLVELCHHGFERIGDRAAEQHRRFEAGWGLTQLESLRQLIEG